MGSHLFTPRSGLNLGIRMRKTYIFLQLNPANQVDPLYILKKLYFKNRPFLRAILKLKYVGGSKFEP
jgi:hypothetical protein